MQAVFHRYVATVLFAVLCMTIPCPTANAAKKSEEQLSAHFLVVRIARGFTKNAHQDYYLLGVGKERRYLGSSNVSQYVEKHFGLTRPEFAVSADGERLLFRHSAFFAGKRSQDTDGIYLVDKHGKARRLEIGNEGGGKWVAWPKPLPPHVIPAFPDATPYGVFARHAPVLVNTEGDSYPLGLHDATRLEQTVFTGNLPAVQAELSAAGVTSASNYWGTPLLDLAMLQGYEDIAISLLKAGAAITETSLATAATYRLERMLDALLERREQFNAAGISIDTAMHEMMRRQPELAYSRLWGDASKESALLDLIAADRRIVVKLLEAGAAVDARGNKDRTAFHVGVIRAASFNIDLKILDEFLRQGADVNAQDVDGNTALHFASSGIVNERDAAHFEQSRRAQLLRYLLAAGADLSLRNASGETALQVATQSNRFRTAELLIDHGADDNELFIYAGMGRNIANQTIRQRIDMVKKELWR